MVSIKAIETIYKGCRFRSRLEARWARFFDAAGIVWNYEPQGYVIDGNPYLPDFYLPGFDFYFEVKGTHEYDKTLIQRFATGIGKRVIMAIGDIPMTGDSSCGSDDTNWDGFRTVFPGGPLDESGNTIWTWDTESWGYGDVFLRCDGCMKIRFMNGTYSTMKDQCGPCPGFSHVRLMPLNDAINAARSARFEHGESN